MALRDDAVVEFLDNGPEMPKVHPQARVDPEQLQEIKRRIRTLGVREISEVAVAMFDDRWNKTKQRAYARVARQLGVSMYALDQLFGINTGSMHAPRSTVAFPDWEISFPPRVLAAAWTSMVGSTRGAKPTKGTKQLQLPGTEGPEPAAPPIPDPEPSMPDAGPLEVVIRQRGRGEMKFAVRSTAEIAKLTKVLEGLL